MGMGWVSGAMAAGAGGGWAGRVAVRSESRRAMRVGGMGAPAGGISAGRMIRDETEESKGC